MNRLTTELTVTVPGKVMLCGEYDVLRQGAHAIAFVLDTRLEVYARYGTSARKSLTLHSDLWDTPMQIDDSTDPADWLAVIVCELLQAKEHKLEEIRVTSQFKPSYGFGSSSALCLALTLIAFLQERGRSLIVPEAKRWQLAGQAFELQKIGQYRASGYDVATQFVGGIVDYSSCGGEWPYYRSVQQMEALEADLHGNLRDIVHIFIGGQGANTMIVMHETINWINAQGHLPLIKVSHALYRAFSHALRNLHSLPELIAATAKWRKWFSTSPYFPQRVAQALQTVKGLDRKWSWKTTGAGGEDAIIVIGYKEDIAAVTACLAELDWQYYNYDIADRGLQLHRL